MTNSMNRYATIAVVIVLAVAVSLFYSSLSFSQGANYQWQTLAGSEYRDSLVPLSYKGGYNNNIIVKWTYTMYNTQSAVGFSISSNPLVVDLDGDGANEVIITDDAGELMIISGKNGNLLLRTNVNASPFSTPYIIDVDNDQTYEIFISTQRGTIICYEINPNGWTITKRWESGVLGQMLPSSPLVYDVNGDGTYEVMVVSPSGFYTLNSLDGSIVTFVKHEFLVLGTSITLAGDVDNDGVSEVVLADSYGLVMLVDPIYGNVQWTTDLSKSLKGFIIHSPAVGDVDGDGSGEVVISMGLEVFDWIPGTKSGQTSTGEKVAKRGVEGSIVILDVHSGVIEAKITYNNGALFAWFSQPSMALGDIDADGVKEIILGSGDGWLYLIDYNGNGYNVLKPVILDTKWSQYTDKDAPPVSSSVLLLDVNRDNKWEIIAFSTDDRNVGGRLDYTLYIIDSNLNVAGELTITYGDLGIGSANSWIFSWPSLSAGDVDGDGVIEIVAIAYQGVICFDW
ncbi:MAG: VCBS repeat-containing protein [Desulfurococcales archaeon]|nr:VCBS repeat-containing protein [Desulfurococcales archaeon]